MALINGDDFVSGSVDSFQQNNRMKDHWRVNNADLTNPQPGMIRSTPATELLSHRQAAAWEEIVQTNTPISDDKQIIGGDGSDAILIPYEETLNDAVIWGIPTDPKRGLIFCDVADIAVNFTGLITAHTQPVAWWVDLDNDSYLGVGHQADDKPGIWASDDLHIQYDANGDVYFFKDCVDGENPFIYIYGYDTGAVAQKHGSFQITNSGGLEIDAQEAGALAQGGAVVIRWHSDRVTWLDDKLAEFGSTNDASIEYDETTNDAWIFGVPVHPKRGLIFCARGDVADNFTGLITAHAQPTVFWSDLDIDSYLAVGHSADDKPDIYSNNILNLQYEAIAGVDLFANASSGETQELRIYGFRAADALRSLEIGVGVDAADTASFDGVSNYFFDGNVGVGIATSIAARLQVDYPTNTTYKSLILSTNAGTKGGLVWVRNDNKWSFQDLAQTTDVFLIDFTGMNIGIGTNLFGANADTVLAMFNGTAPTTSRADSFQMWSDDVLGVANKAGPHWRSEENGMYAWHGGAGTINSFTYQADVADNGTFNLPAITDSAWGFIQAGDNEEYALFTIDNVGNVTLISNSANVVANADTDTKLCLGIASPEEPLTIKNALGAEKNINLIIWYS